MRMNIGRVLSHTAGGLAEEMRTNREFVRDAKDRLKADLFNQKQERANAQKKVRLEMESAVDFLFSLLQLTSAYFSLLQLAQVYVSN